MAETQNNTPQADTAPSAAPDHAKHQPAAAEDADNLSLLNTAYKLQKNGINRWEAASDTAGRRVYIPAGESYVGAAEAKEKADELNTAYGFDEKNGFAVITVNDKSFPAISPRRLKDNQKHIANEIRRSDEAEIPTTLPDYVKHNLRIPLQFDASGDSADIQHEFFNPNNAKTIVSAFNEQDGWGWDGSAEEKDHKVRLIHIDKEGYGEFKDFYTKPVSSGDNSINGKTLTETTHERITQDIEERKQFISQMVALTERLNSYKGVNASLRNPDATSPELVIEFNSGKYPVVKNARDLFTAQQEQSGALENLENNIKIHQDMLLEIKQKEREAANEMHTPMQELAKKLKVKIKQDGPEFFIEGVHNPDAFVFALNNIMREQRVYDSTEGKNVRAAKFAKIAGDKIVLDERFLKEKPVDAFTANDGLEINKAISGNVPLPAPAPTSAAPAAPASAAIADSNSPEKAADSPSSASSPATSAGLGATIGSLFGGPIGAIVGIVAGAKIGGGAEGPEVVDTPATSTPAPAPSAPAPAGSTGGADTSTPAPTGTTAPPELPAPVDSPLDQNKFTMMGMAAPLLMMLMGAVDPLIGILLLLVGMIFGGMGRIVKVGVSWGLMGGEKPTLAGMDKDGDGLNAAELGAGLDTITKDGKLDVRELRQLSPEDQQKLFEVLMEEDKIKKAEEKVLKIDDKNHVIEVDLNKIKAPVTITATPAAGASAPAR